MNKEQMLLLKVAEECGELAQMCSKSIRFGLNNHKPGETSTNFERLESEMEDLLAAFDYLLTELKSHKNIYTYAGVDFNNKRDRIDKYLQVSRDLGILKD